MIQALQEDSAMGHMRWRCKSKNAGKKWWCPKALLYPISSVAMLWYDQSVLSTLC